MNMGEQSPLHVQNLYISDGKSKPIKFSNEPVEFTESDFNLSENLFSLDSFEIELQMNPKKVLKALFKTDYKYCNKYYNRRVFHLALKGKTRRVRKKNRKRCMGKFKP